MNNEKHIIISLGGSLIVPDEIDVGFLKEFTSLIKDYAGRGFRFVIITGGGKICRKYQNALGELGNKDGNDLDWLGIYSTHLNAQFIRLALGGLAYDQIITDRSLMVDTDKPVIVGAGEKPGASTDTASVSYAEKLGAKKLINLSNIDYAYDKDPNKFPDAVKIEQSSWADFRSILPTEWNPGLSSPFDPIAAQKAEALGLEVVIMNGKNIDNLKKYLDGGEFVGTVIR
jgi:uridylate kinase